MAEKVRRFSELEARAPASFRLPAPKLRAPVLSLATKGFPLPEGDNEQTTQRYNAWNSFYGGSLPEFIAWEYLVLKRKQVLGLDFLFQAPFLGGRTQFGGFVLDFFLIGPRVGWMIQGERYHLLNPNDRAKNAIVKMMLARQAIRALELWEDDLLTRPEFVLDAAFYREEEIPTRARV